jgi:hypothetical protein
LAWFVGGAFDVLSGLVGMRRDQVRNREVDAAFYPDPMDIEA